MSLIDVLTVVVLPQRKANGVDMSIDADQLEGMSEDELRRRYDEQSRGRAGVPGARNTEGTTIPTLARIYLLVSLTL